MSVRDQKMKGKDDQSLALVCATEGRAFITMDLDFSNILNFPPELYAGIIVLRTRAQGYTNVLTLVDRALTALKIEPVAQRLWIVGDTDIRIREPKTP